MKFVRVIYLKSNFPDWLKKRYPASGEIESTKKLLEHLGINTVCQSAICPNLGECFAKRTATFMIMGDNCTRNCRFCAVTKAEPTSLDAKEPRQVAKAVKQLGLKHVVITSVTRDDLSDGGAGHFADTINSIKELSDTITIEVLTPDFEGNKESISKVVHAMPHIYNHNVETVPRLYSQVRPKAVYETSLMLLEAVKQIKSNVYTKSGLMVGLGERREEVVSVMQDLRSVGCDIVTIGQYLSPSSSHYPVQEFVHPDVFLWYERKAKEMGFLHAASGPFVRSSYHADHFSKTHLQPE